MLFKIVCVRVFPSIHSNSDSFKYVIVSVLYTLYAYYHFNLALTFFKPALGLFVSLAVQVYAYCCLNYS